MSFPFLVKNEDLVRAQEVLMNSLGWGRET